MVNMSGLTQALVFASGVIMGTGSTITIKYIYGLEAVGLSGDLQRFEKPLSTTWVMFVAMTLALPIHFVQVWYNRRSARAKNGINYSRIEELEDSDSVPWSTYFLLVIPACFDLMGTALAQIGLLFCTVSVYQLVRCTVIIVTALLKATVLKQKLSNYMWIGIAVNTIAMALVSMTSFLEPVQEGNNRDARIGIFFILLSCIVQGSQYVFEEKVMTVDNAPPLIVVGMEGLWGTLLMPLVVFPWAYILPGTDYGGCVENVYDAWVMTLNSVPIQITLLAFTITVWLYNIFCIYVTFLLNSIWHAILDNFRPVSVWATDLVLFYVFTHQTFGEAWTKYSWIELFGMILLFIGTAIYNGSIQLPGYIYPAVSPLEDGIEAGPMTPQIRVSTPQMASPFLTRSPLVDQSIRRQRERRMSSEFHHLKSGSIPSSNYGATSSHAHANYPSSRAKNSATNASERR